MKLYQIIFQIMEPMTFVSTVEADSEEAAIDKLKSATQDSQGFVIQLIEEIARDDTIEAADVSSDRVLN